MPAPSKAPTVPTEPEILAREYLQKNEALEAKLAKLNQQTAKLEEKNAELLLIDDLSPAQALDLAQNRALLESVALQVARVNRQIDELAGTVDAIFKALMRVCTARANATGAALRAHLINVLGPFYPTPLACEFEVERLQAVGHLTGPAFLMRQFDDPPFRCLREVLNKIESVRAECDRLDGLLPKA